ncbi:LuxR C-terminal-related transcriptional regulator [Zavarzinia compransoris]|uniref:LuxR C-terminal-related transcriptional regulator n=1 Tax=Zavarzinia marina TaxID=2911065 RepID=UPI001F45F3D7|nr:LuxR C-terminal-related transcriptional regulator [Zavarzinia marina]MCF4167000.1 LuxR C-terminal-related transcriptional regulator [Zavarzinia marina]
MAKNENGLWRNRIIQTKLNAPIADKRLLRRAHLYEGFLETRTPLSLMTVVAAAGSGKSTTMAHIHQHFAENGTRTAWLTVDAEDDEPSAFATYLIGTLQRAMPGFGEREAEVLRGNMARDMRDIFASVLGEMSECAKPTALFLDDFHHITHPMVIEFMDRLIANHPPCLKLVIASRLQPPLSITKRRLDGTLLEIGQQELRFSHTEAFELLNTANALDLSSSEIAELNTTTEGWATGLQLAALALSRGRGSTRDLIHGFSGKDRDLAAYLVERVMRLQPEATKKFLLRTAPLSRMSPELCQEVSGHPQSGEMMALLERSSMFIIPLDREGRWFRYHHLFADFLVAMLKRDEPGSFETICVKAANWCEHNGHLTEAIQYFLQAGHFSEAARLIVTHAPRVAQHYGDHQTVLAWMRALPPAFARNHPVIALNHAWSLTFSRECNRAVSVVEEVEALINSDDPNVELDGRSREQLLWTAEVTKWIAKVCGDRPDYSAAGSRAIRATLPDSEPFLIASISNCMAYSYLTDLTLDKALQAAADAYLHGSRAEAVYATVWADFLGGCTAAEQGRLGTAADLARRAEASARDHVDQETYFGALAALVSAEVHVQRCEFDRVADSLQVTSSFTNLFGPMEPLLRAYRNEARMHAFTGDLVRARRTLQNGQDIAISTEQPRLFVALATEEASLQLTAGDVTGAVETVVRTKLSSREHPLMRGDQRRNWREPIKILEGRIAVAEGRTDHALQILTPLTMTLASEHRDNRLCLVRGIRALALWKAGRYADAARELDKALALAAPEEMAYPLVAVGAGLIPVLDEIIESRTQAAAVGQISIGFESRLRRLLAGKPAAPGAEASALPEAAAIDNLTSREIEILRHVGAGHDNRQLAKILLVSEPTVKWHLHNIYSKFGVRNRTAAVAKAKAMSLI